MDSKTILVYVDNIPQFKVPVLQNAKIREIKDYFYKIYPNHNIRMFLNTKTELNVFDTSKYDNMTLNSVWSQMETPVILLKTPPKPLKTPIKNIEKPLDKIIEEGNYNNLPNDVKKYLITYLEPIQVLELCKNLSCDWKQLLDINYDFVTQGFTPRNLNPKDKFEYLATRVSKNRNLKDGEIPEKIFVHYDGIPLGTKRFYNQHLDDYDEYKLDGMRKTIIKTLTSIPGVEAREDDMNLWIKIKSGTKLPDRIVFDNKTYYIDLYDYPDMRRKYIESVNQENNEDNNKDGEGYIDYPGNVIYTPEIEESMRRKLTDLIEMNVDEDVENGREVEETLMNLGIYNSTPEYKVYGLMREGFTRSEAEVFVKYFP
jgi:hypothetical protein